MRRVLFGFLSLCCAGCYRYATIQPETAVTGTSVRARVNLAAERRIAPLLGAQSARVLTGTLIGDGRDTMIVEVPVITHDDPRNGIQTLHQRVSIPRTELVELESRTLDRGRTTVLVGGAAIIAGSVLLKVLKGDPGAETLPGGGGTDALVPLFRIRW